MSEFEEIRSFSVPEPDAGKRLDIYLADASGFSRSRVRKLIDDGMALVNDAAAVKPSYPVREGDAIELLIPATREPQFLPEEISLDIVYEDDRLLVVNKPAGMVVHPGCGNVTGTLAAGLLHYCRTISKHGGAQRPGIVHRLDMDTSGLLVIALDDDMHAALSHLIAERKIKRIYTAFVWGHPDPVVGSIDAPIGRHPNNRTLKAVVENGRPAVTHYETSARYRFLSRLIVRLETGRTHQIRVHFAHIGRHVFGDPDYGGREERLKGFSPDIREEARALLRILHRQALHAGQLEFRHPATGQALSFHAPLPEDLRRLQEELEREI
ncbi:MAG: RluA family pseudouridine synthase [Candidatus Latescibacterota bacterium]